jgi:hypothetical protein
VSCRSSSSSPFMAFMRQSMSQYARMAQSGWLRGYLPKPELQS